MIARYGTGADGIYVAAAAERGGRVTNVSDCVDEMGEHTLALILALERGITVYDRAGRDGGAALDTVLCTCHMRGDFRLHDHAQGWPYSELLVLHSDRGGTQGCGICSLNGPCTE